MYTYLQTEGLNMTYGIQTMSIRICWLYPDILLASSLFKNSIASQISKFTRQLLNSEYSSCHEQWSMNMSMDNFDGAEDLLSIIRLSWWFLFLCWNSLILIYQISPTYANFFSQTSWTVPEMAVVELEMSVDIAFQLHIDIS